MRRRRVSAGRSRRTAQHRAGRLNHQAAPSLWRIVVEGIVPEPEVTMKRSKPAATKVAVEKAPTRYVPDPHRRHRIVESAKIYTRKARPKVGPSDFRGACIRRRQPRGGMPSPFAKSGRRRPRAVRSRRWRSRAPAASYGFQFEGIRRRSAWTLRPGLDAQDRSRSARLGERTAAYVHDPEVGDRQRREESVLRPQAFAIDLT